MDKCHLCEKPIDKNKEIFYQHQRLVVNDKLIRVLLCEGCMADLHRCTECGIARPYCSECV